MRHGPAGGRGAWVKKGRSDADRPLTPEGRKKTRAAAAGLARLLGGADLVATSPWARAHKTAEYVAAALDAPLTVSALLLPDRPPEDLAAWLAGLGKKRVVLVGHEPHLSRCASRLVGGGRFALKKAQAALIADGVLLWSLPGRVLRGAR